MKITELIESEQKNNPDLIAMFREVLPLIVKFLDLKSLPKIKLEKTIEDEDQPTFGRYVNGEDTLYLSLDNRHPVDIMRTFAHEMVHYKQDLNQQLGHSSGDTGSPAENQANALAGVIMRFFNKKHPEFLKADSIKLP